MLNNLSDFEHQKQMKVKLFIRNPETGLEGTVNEWLADNPQIKITQVTQSESSVMNRVSVTISIWYEDQ